MGGYQAIMFVPDLNQPEPELGHGRGHAWGNVGKDLLTGGEPSINGSTRLGRTTKRTVER